MVCKCYMINRSNEITPITFFNINIFSGFIEGPCKDITFGACTLDRSNIIKNGTQSDAVTCQEACRNHDGCQFFRFSDQFNSKCTLLREEYRRNCDIIGGSLVCNLSIQKSIDSFSRFICVVIFLVWKCRRMP